MDGEIDCFFILKSEGNVIVDQLIHTFVRGKNRAYET